MADAIYLIKNDQEAIRMEPKAYAKEEEFQGLLEKFPELLAGEQIDRNAPRRWLHVAREMPVPDSEGATGRWQLDHFFVDQDGIPTLVEVKRQSDTRLRREVVGQVLEYAANGARFWPEATLASQFDKTCRDAKTEPGVVLATFLSSGDYAPQEFWKVVENNLRKGAMRLIFLADEVPEELQRIVEFLNEQMTETWVLAIEVRRYVGEGFSTHVPRLLGQTTAAALTKESSKAGMRRKWDEESFFAAAASLPDTVQSALRKLYALSREPGFSARWGTGTANGSLNVIVPTACIRSVVSLMTNGEMRLNFEWLPLEVQVKLAAFAKDTLAGDWEEDNLCVPGDVWAPSADQLIAFLRSLQAT